MCSVYCTCVSRRVSLRGGESTAAPHGAPSPQRVVFLLADLPASQPSRMVQSSLETVSVLTDSFAVHPQVPCQLADPTVRKLLLTQIKPQTKNPALVVFRLCLRTSSEHLGQAGCFRLPAKACRPQPALCVPESFTLRSEFSSRTPRTGQGKF